MHVNRDRALRRISALTATAGALALLTACGGTTETAASAAHPTTTTAAPSASATESQPASFNNADVMFAQMMIPHHQQAVEMADLAETRAADPEVKELATKIKAAQAPEIATMTGWLRSWGKPATMDHGMDHNMPGMMSDQDMTALENAKGPEFDKSFLRLMIAHHEGAITMAKAEESQGRSPEATELARTIATTQRSEIDQMRQILNRL
ncbi:DUF305 domain-containing protein [Spongiactinospora sp. TRM90649]|uniref:DUF305 domain-containing protein n=1 Tax=Spongiactinospora sp. TRM90649 TaxID=3031114 RepID=UPI0023F930DF|nr:DUF305 domain-containing protein [Spongiactinospora sp. TRM90649]MDF5753619.1 DUF305 domain-containing protein [Spongiactinospora sp. TRM90649]